jgi:signal recognition particle subunit SRP54
MFDNLSDKLDRAFKVLKGHGKISEINVAETTKEIRKALLDADVNYKVAKTFTDRVKEKAMGQNVLTSLTPGQLLVKITHDELKDLMGGEMQEINMKGNPVVILMSGLQGSGKTTLSGKLAYFLKNKKGKSPLLVACDIYRPAAINQLIVLGGQISVPVYSEPENKNPVEIAQKAIKHAKDRGYNVVIIDTAGRLAIDDEMMNEIVAIKYAINPSEILFVVDAMTGQDAVNTAKTFNDRLDFDGVVLTKLDGDTRGGAALSIKTVVNKPIKLVGTGEKMEALELFYPERMADRILGMGDIVSLVERVEQHFSEEEGEALAKKMRKGDFTFQDMLSQINTVKKMGNIKDLAAMVPGMGKKLKDIDMSDDKFNLPISIIQSMTPEERSCKVKLDTRRKNRIAKGSGRTAADMNLFLSNFEKAKEQFKLMTEPGNMKRMGQMMNRK